MKTFTVTITEQDCSIIGQALGTLPYKDVFELITRLNVQLVQQQRPEPAMQPN